MVIDNSYFQGNLSVPNSQEALTPLSDRRGNKVNLAEYIERYERQIMIYALGLTLYNDFKDQFETNGDLKVGATDRWKDFVNGVEYTVNSEDFEWKGLRYEEGGLKYSLITNYVYSKFLPDIATTFGSAGTQRNNTKASRGYSSIPKTVDAWNEFIYLYQGNETDSYPARIVYKPGLIGIDYSGSRDADFVVSMYRFLQDNLDDYSGLQTKLFAKQNSFGL